MSSEQTLRAGVIGVGHLGQHHARLYSQIDGVELVGVCDADAERAGEIASQWGGESFAGPGALFDRVDLVSVATPTVTHTEIALPFLERGIHVLVEKPIAATLDEADALIAAARASGATLQVGHTERYNPAVEAIRQYVGSPRFIEAHRMGSFRPRSTDIDVVLDLMIHDLDVILNLVDSPVASAEAAGVSALTDKIDIANARLRFDNGCVANVTASRISTAPTRKLRIFQPASYVSLDYAQQDVRFYRLERRPGEDQAEICQVPIEVTREEPLRRELESFLESIRGDQAPLVTGEDGRRALELAHQILESVV